MEQIVRRVWQNVLEYETVRSAEEQALFVHLLMVAKSATSEDTPEHVLLTRLEDEIRAKQAYLDGSFGYIDAAAIVAAVDECAIALQALPIRAFLDPLNWDLRPPLPVIATVKAVLLLFNLPYPSHVSDADIWKSHWGLWIVKNIDAHTSGWEWVATNEPMGLFTKPYVLSDAYLPQVQRLLASTSDADSRSWHRMTAYALLRDWAKACVAYGHLRAHFLPSFPGYDAIHALLTPPKRTPPVNVWFRLESPHGIEYFYNRLEQSLTLERPNDFDGGNVTSIPLATQELIQDALLNDHATRLELERRGHRRVHDKLLAEDEWVECVDSRTQQKYYYSFRHYRVSASPPQNGIFLPYTESVAYRAVVRLQTAYRKRRLQHKLQIKKTKRASLPVFSSMSKGKNNYY